MADGTRPVNYFVRTLLGLFCILLAGMVLFRYFLVLPLGDITPGVLALLSLLVVLVLAESFDSFSVGKLIAISREAKKKEAEVEKLEKSNASLMSQLITISNSQSQRQSSTTVQGDYYATAPVVQKATEAEVQEKQTSERRAIAAAASTLEATAPARMNWARAESLALDRVLKQKNIHPSNLITEAKLSFLQGIDPISNIQPIFDGYLKEPGRETFIEIRPERMMTPMYRDRLYVMLSKIHHYRATKNVEAQLDVVILKVPGEEVRNFGLNADRFFEFFEPSIASGLLTVQEIEFTEAEAADCRKP